MLHRRRNDEERDFGGAGQGDYELGQLRLIHNADPARISSERA
jgi:hypothetical protein